VNDPPRAGVKGSVVPGCPACQKIIYTDNQYLSHLALDVLPGILEKVTPSLSELFNENEALNILSVFWIVFRSARETYNFPANLEDRRISPGIIVLSR
jgi:hypothetical protein